MHILRKIPRGLRPDEPVRHGDHPRPLTRRELISAGLRGGAALVMVPAAVAAVLRSGAARANVIGDLDAAGLDATGCGISAGAGKIPFICFDLTGGANIAGSNVLIGGPGGQLDFLSTAGYSKLGLPGEMAPNGSGANSFIDASFGLAFHSDSAFLRGMKLKAASATTQAGTNGAIIAARSENDTANNPHNPMYGIWRAGADGQLLTLIGSRASDSGGNSVAPASMIDLSVRPTKVDRASDVTGLVDTGELGTLFPNPADAVAVLESMAVLNYRKLDAVQTKVPSDADLKRFNKCAYVKSAYLAEQFSSPAALDPSKDPNIAGPGGIFTPAELAGDAEFQKTAAVMKMVIDGNAGAGTVQMGGFDYHTGDRATGELRDFRAGKCIGACLEYAARTGKPLMIYVFSDGSLSSNGTIDSSVDGRGKGVWTGDNQSTAASFFLVFNPRGRAALRGGAGGLPAERHQQIGYYRADGSIDTTSSPAANAVNLLVETVVLNYLALHGEEGRFPTLFPNHGLGGTQLRDGLTSFAPIVNSVIGG
ncbi:MAG: hypothetical protein WCE48_10800 [Steroidobacteraceae bacterium]